MKKSKPIEYSKIKDRDYIYYMYKFTAENEDFISKEWMIACSHLVIERKTGDIIKNRDFITLEHALDQVYEIDEV